MWKLTICIGVTAIALCFGVRACQAAPAQPVSDDQVLVEGAARADDAVRAGGHDVPLLHALERIVPPSYSVNVPNAGPWADAPVSWRAGRSFVRVLRDLLADNPSLQVHINTDLKLVTLTARASAPMRSAQETDVSSTGATEKVPDSGSGRVIAKTGGASLANAASVLSASAVVAASAVSIVEPSAPASQAVAIAAPSQVWQLNLADRTVKGALGRWAREAGWQFVWAVPTDFSIDASATINGTFEAALGQVVDALRGSQVPIQVVLYKGNRVLRVVAKGAN